MQVWGITMNWQQLMTKGNDCFNQQAQGYYEGAIEQLDAMLLENPKQVEAIQGWICGYHNLSALHVKTGNVVEAQRCLLIPHQSMMHLIEQEGLDDDHKLIAFRATKITLTALLEFTQDFPICQSCSDRLMAQYLAVTQPESRFH